MRRAWWQSQDEPTPDEYADPPHAPAPQPAEPPLCDPWVCGPACNVEPDQMVECSECERRYNPEEHGLRDDDGGFWCDSPCAPRLSRNWQ